MQKTVLSIAFAATLLLASAITPSLASDATPNGSESLSPPVPGADANHVPAHTPTSWYICLGRLKLCGPRHIECGRCN